jgi:hypothetical protein
MKHRITLSVCIALSLAGSVDAQDIRKCVDHGVVGYQNVPCAAGQVDAGLVKLPDYADPPQRDGAFAPPQEAYGTAPAVDDVTPPAPVASRPAPERVYPFRTSIALGMTDDQVLNIPRWGPPTRIERVGRHRGWRETWIYSNANAVRRLTFVEGRLADISVGTPATQVASVER